MEQPQQEQITPVIKYENEISRTEMFYDFVGFENMTQLQLNKLVLKYNNIYAKNITAIHHLSPVNRYYLQKVFKKINKKIHERQVGDNCPYNVKLFKNYKITMANNIASATAIYESQKAELVITQKEHYTEHQNEKVICQCGGHYSNRNKQIHLKSLKHLSFINKELGTI